MELKPPFEVPKEWAALHGRTIKYLLDAFPELPFAEADLELSAFFVCCTLLDPKSPIGKLFLTLAKEEWAKESEQLKALLSTIKG